MNGLYFDHFLLLEVLLWNIDRYDISVIQNGITILKKNIFTSRYGAGGGDVIIVSNFKTSKSRRNTIKCSI
jgi:hypothetical protein